MKVIVQVTDLKVKLPDGTAVVEQADLVLHAGEIISLLGPSGAGKSTLVRAMFTPDDLLHRGYDVTWSDRDLHLDPAFVPQRGALFDHLDVAGNIALAQHAADVKRDIVSWLEAFDLPNSLALPGQSVALLSGGEAQRLAVTRALAAGRKLIVLDEPSVGLDPWGVRQLAKLLLKQAREENAALFIITHDLTLAAGVSDRLYYLDPTSSTLVHVLPDWTGPAEFDESERRRTRIDELEHSIEVLLKSERPQKVRKRSASSAVKSVLAPVWVAGDAFLSLFRSKLRRQSRVVFRRALIQALLRPLAFYMIVGILLGITVPYIIVHISTSLRPAAVLGLIGGAYILALAPPLSAIVFAATSGSAINAWLGGLRLHGQVMALEGLGIAPSRYLWSPAWWALALSYLITLLCFAAAMTAGGYLLFQLYHVPDAFQKLTADFFDPPPSRLPYLVRAAWLVVAYSLVVASVVVAKGRELKDKSEQVTQAMTSGVMQSTLLVVSLELISVAVLYAVAGQP